MKKLHLGCGSKYIEGFTNVDILSDVKTDLNDNVGALIKVEDNSVDLIYACHVLEHFGRHEYKNVLSRWYNVLKEGGILRVAVPDLEACVEYYNQTKDMSKLLGFFWGGQNHKYNFHYMGWDFKSLSADLKSVGFKNIYRYDWRNTEHSNIDDFSQAYLPHMQKESGKLMSLNIEAVK
jgi:predicted SAM-dependent methyltransferase